MADELNTVKTAYHHGALRPALIEAAEAVIAERGLDRFSLRETARRAGVSPAAPAHHFGDTRGLLTAIATAGFVDLAEALEAADAAPTRDQRIFNQGLAYVRFAIERPARFDLMWRDALLDTGDPGLAEAGRDAFMVLDRAVRGDNAPRSGRDDPAVAPSYACWAMVHGFARLALDGAFGDDAGAPARAAETLLPAVLRHLHV
jgi:AcrR family transcriptional regulator